LNLSAAFDARVICVHSRLYNGHDVLRAVAECDRHCTWSADAAVQSGQQ